MWTSYSDLFLGLSIVFLLLYVTASLKQGTDGIRQHFENQRLAKEAADLRQQIKVYETLKQDYLKQQASTEEQENYEELMKKLSLLQEEAKDEKTKLRLQAQENEKKEMALNKYQQMIRNIVNSNMIAKARIKNRDNLIDTRDEEITEKTGEISDLEKTVAQKQAAIKQSEDKIADMKGQLDKRMKQLRNAYASHKISKQKFEQAQAQARKDADSRIRALQAANARTRQELNDAAQELEETNSKLSETNSKLNAAQGDIAKLGEEKNRLEGELAGADAKRKAEIDRLKGDFDGQRAKDRAAFEAQLAKEKLSGAQRAAREAAFKAEAERKAGELAGKIADLDKKYRDSQGALAKAHEKLNAQKKLAQALKDNFAKYGVKADVDPGTGDVMLSFGDQYFDSGHADLKPKMRQILEQAMPAYSASLFENEKISNKINSVEIVGFASPTYKGKYIDPSSLRPEDRQAVNYNLDLSYNRARSIFNYVFDKDKMSFKHQERLLPLVKVTGRSFLSNEKSRDPAAMSRGETSEGFCKVNDCAKLQRVIIKFTLKD